MKNTIAMQSHIYSQKSVRYFDVDEQTVIIKYISTPLDRDKFLVDITRGLAKTNDKKTLYIMLNIIKRVRNMTVEEFSKVDLSEALDALPEVD